MIIHSPRVITSRLSNELKAEMSNIGAEWPGVMRMARKAAHFIVKVHNLRTPAVLILKEEMLSKGGDCAIHREAITNRVERSDCILIGTEKVFSLMLEDLRAQQFGLPKLADEIQAVLRNFTQTSPLTPSESVPEALSSFYSLMKERTLIMGILNMTPDSFSDGGMFGSLDTAVERAILMVEEGADVLDVGGESSRPCSEPVSADEELRRVIPLIESLAGRVTVPISIDTYKPEVARAALDAGANIINDISGLSDNDMRKLAAERKCPSIIMHMKGTPKTMQEAPTYTDVIDEIIEYFAERMREAEAAGLPKEYLILDPGIGFGKTYDHNLQIIRKLGDFKSFGLPILVGTSRKAFIGKALGDLPPQERIWGTAATVSLCIQNGANVIRVHDVKEMVQVGRMTDAVLRQGANIEPDKHGYP